MKRFFVTFAILLFGGFSFAPAFAQEAETTPLSFFDAQDNLQKLDNYQMGQTVSGKFEVEETLLDAISINLKGNYRFFLNSDVITKEAYKADTSTAVRGQVLVEGAGNNRPFESLKANFSGNVRWIDGDGLYAQLNGLEIMAEGVPDDEQASYQQFQNELSTKMQAVRGHWFYVPATVLSQNGEDADIAYQLIQEKGLKELIKEQLKFAIQTFVISAITDETGSPPDGVSADDIAKAVDDFFDTDFFYHRTIETGPLQGFVNYFFNKYGFVEAVKKFVSATGESLSADKEQALRDFLQTFTLSMRTHTDTEHQIFDKFKFRLVLRDIEMLNYFSLNYLQKISDINESVSVSAPASFESYENLDLSF